MRTVFLNAPDAAPEDPQRLAALTRHLRARLLDFGPGGPALGEVDEAHGVISAQFPGHDFSQVAAALEGMGVHLALENDTARFYLHSHTRFEDLDYVWGCLFEVL